ncbi:predicted protein [Botrytis cinerea T4]|uniref:Uncharacterized protein n=1 Tax=Botryotinia fuckeliana (strain T4) TaxID=999810 RepID=G2XV89_BOTF4|nr:predicted protein [Botrytis cinerea T4]
MSWLEKKSPLAPASSLHSTLYTWSINEMAASVLEFRASIGRFASYRALIM